MFAITYGMRDPDLYAHMFSPEEAQGEMFQPSSQEELEQMLAEWQMMDAFSAASD